MVREEMTESVKNQRKKQVETVARLPSSAKPRDSSPGTEDDEEANQKRSRRAEKLREQLRAGGFEDQQIEMNVEERASVVGVLGQAGMEMDIEFQSMFEKMLPTKARDAPDVVRDARKVLFAQEAEKLIDKEKSIAPRRSRRAERIVFLDELDKIAGTDKTHGPDVSRQGVQRGFAADRRRQHRCSASTAR